MTRYQSIEDVRSDFAAVTERTDDSLFEEGRVIADAVDQGFDRKLVVSECAKLRGMSDRTTRNREKAYRVFEKRGKRAVGICHSLHVLCLEGTDVDDEGTWDKAERLIEIAAAGYTDDDGNIRPHTTRTFKAALAAIGENVDSEEPTFLLDAQPGRLWNCKPRPDIQGTILELFVPLNIKLPEHVDIVITLVQSPAQEANAA